MHEAVRRAVAELAIQLRAEQLSLQRPSVQDRVDEHQPPPREDLAGGEVIPRSDRQQARRRLVRRDPEKRHREPPAPVALQRAQLGFGPAR